jgi:hypothetical protein
VPALVVGTKAGGIYGASVAEAAVAASCVLPWYLVELRKAGIQMRALSRHLWLPAAGAAVAGLLAWGTAEVAPNDFTALAVSGTATAAIAGLILYRMRATVALLRSVSAEPDAVPAADTVAAAPAPDTMVLATDTAKHSQRRAVRTPLLRRRASHGRDPGFTDIAREEQLS